MSATPFLWVMVILGVVNAALMCFAAIHNRGALPPAPDRHRWQAMLIELTLALWALAILWSER